MTGIVTLHFVWLEGKMRSWAFLSSNVRRCHFPFGSVSYIKRSIEVNMNDYDLCKIYQNW